MTTRFDTSRSVGAALSVVFILLAASSCDSSAPRPYGLIHDAGLSADGRLLLVLVEVGTTTTDSSNNLWRGDITTTHRESMQIHEFDRRTGQRGRVLSHPPPGESGTRPTAQLADYADGSSAPTVSLKDCRELYTECAEATTPQPYRVGLRVLDPKSGKSIEWDGRQLVVVPFAAMSAPQIRAAREALLRRSIDRMHAAATKDFAARAASEDPERIETGEAGTVEREPGMAASYRLLPRRVIFARFRYADVSFQIVWQRDGACVIDNAMIAAQVVGCQRVDDGGVERAVRGIALARAPDPDRTGTTWGVLTTSGIPETPQGSITVACHGLPRETAGKPCDVLTGDTACRTSLPMLCSNADASFPPQSPRARRLALTTQVRGTELVSVAAADQVCRTSLGDGWKMAEATESMSRYQITGIGSLSATSRFWVRNGDGLANCW